MKKTIYNKNFYEDQMDGSKMSASKIFPILFKEYFPSSVIDIGCGTGAWLKIALENGVKEIKGVDGDYVDYNSLQIPKDFFIPKDISQIEFKDIGTRYDLAVSLEVAEHLDIKDSENFIKLLTELSDVVLFSAAVPYQGGTNHLNENWLEFWASLFKSFDFYPIDIIREKIWDDPDVCYWYKQNIMVFAKKEKAKEIFSSFNKEKSVYTHIHPELFLWACARNRNKNKNLKINFGKDKNNYEEIVSFYRNNRKLTPMYMIEYKNMFNVSFQTNYFDVFRNKVVRLIKKLMLKCKKKN